MNEAEDAMQRAVAEFLTSNGWIVAVIGSSRVEHQPTALQFNFEFVVRFTGEPPKDATGKDEG